MFLHSILGTGTNTFAMTADKIPALRELMDPCGVEAGRGLSLRAAAALRRPAAQELRDNLHRARRDRIDPRSTA
jgi:hypothetical protein